MKKLIMMKCIKKEVKFCFNDGLCELKSESYFIEIYEIHVHILGFQMKIND